MPIVSRATLPQEFFDINSAKLLLPPEPQYFHGRLFQVAFNASLNASGALGLPLPGRQFGEHGDPYITDVPGLILSDPLMSSAIEVVSEIGQGTMPGHTIRINRPNFANTTYTEISRDVAENSTISTTPIALNSDQVPVTVHRYAGPYDQTNGRVAPLGFGRFDGHFMQHRPTQISALNLVRDFKRTVDAFLVAYYDNAGTTVRPRGMTTDAIPAQAGDYPMSAALINAVQRTQDDANVPTFPDGKRVFVMHPRQREQLVNDANFSRAAQFHKEFNTAFAGSYFGSYGGYHLFTSTTLTVVLGGVGTLIPIYYAQAFGPGAVGAGVADLPRIAFNTQDNYGETALVIWLMYAAFATLDNRFICGVHTS